MLDRHGLRLEDDLYDIVDDLVAKCKEQSQAPSREALIDRLQYVLSTREVFSLCHVTSLTHLGSQGSGRRAVQEVPNAVQTIRTTFWSLLAESFASSPVPELESEPEHGPRNKPSLIIFVGDDLQLFSALLDLSTRLPDVAQKAIFCPFNTTVASDGPAPPHTPQSPKVPEPLHMPEVIEIPEPQDTLAVLTDAPVAKLRLHQDHDDHVIVHFSAYLDPPMPEDDNEVSIHADGVYLSPDPLRLYRFVHSADRYFRFLHYAPIKRPFQQAINVEFNDLGPYPRHKKVGNQIRAEPSNWDITIINKHDQDLYLAVFMCHNSNFRESEYHQWSDMGTPYL